MSGTLRGNSGSVNLFTKISVHKNLVPIFPRPFSTQKKWWVSSKQQPEGPLTEDPATRESHHDNGRVFSRLKQPSRSNTLAEELIRMEDGLHLNPLTINPVIRMSRLGPFFCPRDSEALSEQFRARSLQHLF